MTPRRKPSGRETRHILDRTTTTTAQLLALLGAVAMAAGAMIFLRHREQYLTGVLAVVLGTTGIVLSLFVNAAARLLLTMFDMLEHLVQRQDPNERED